MLQNVILSSKEIIVPFAKVYKHHDLNSEFFCDILLVMPDFNPKNLKITAKTVIAYGDLGFKSFKNIKSEQIITYGMSNKNTITISSSFTNEILVAIQREFIGINGNLYEVSEYLTEKITENPLETLAISIFYMINGK